MAIVRLKPGREKSVVRRHPWIFSGAVLEVRGAAQDGETVEVLSADETWLAKGAYSSKSQIRVRIWSWDPDEEIDPKFFQKRIEKAIELRRWCIDPAQANAYRLIHAESDGLPGLIVDCYHDILVIQCLSWGAERWREAIVKNLVELTNLHSVYERSDVDVRRLEGLEVRSGLIQGEMPPERVKIREHGIHYWVDLAHGHKTGFYLDQRANRRIIGQLAEGRETLDCFSYTGGFALSALKGGAKSCLGIEASGEAIQLARENIDLNGVNHKAVDWIQGNAFQVLRQLRDQGRKFDLVVTDPPKFAATAAQAERAARGYKDINLLGLKLLRPGGILGAFSCSGGINADLFQKILAGAALDAGVEARIIQRLSQDRDHPVALNFPEGEYLKGLLVYVE